MIYIFQFSIEKTLNVQDIPKKNNWPKFLCSFLNIQLLKK